MGMGIQRKARYLTISSLTDPIPTKRMIISLTVLQQPLTIPSASRSALPLSTMAASNTAQWQCNYTYKPIGFLHDYGENDAMLFGLLTGSYQKNMSGGVLRKVVSSFSNEVDPKTGKFTNVTAPISRHIR